MEVIEACWFYSEEGQASQLLMTCLANNLIIQISKKAIERNEALRAAYRVRISSNYAPEQLVFVDESACDRRTYMRNEAWALEGLRACRKQFFTRGKR